MRRARASDALSASAWPADRSGEMLRGLAAAVGFGVGFDTAATAPPAALSAGAAERLPDLARGYGLAAESVTVTAREGWAAIERAAPGVLELPGGAGCLAVVRASGGRAELWTPDGRRRVSATAVEDALWAPVESGSGATLALAALPVGSGGRRKAAARILLTPDLGGRPLAEAWAVRPLTTRMRDELGVPKVGRRAAAIVTAYLAQFALLLAIWNQVGGRALSAQGGGERAAVVELAALLGGWVLAQLAASWLLGRLALDVGARVRAALMRGALRLDRDRLRSAGVGQLLGRAMDADVLDVLALGGGVETAAAMCELILGVVVLGLGAAPVASLSALALVLVALVAVARVQSRWLFAWSRRRRSLTHDLVERMVGHRTVLVQDRPAARAVADREALDAYDRGTRVLDRWETILAVAIPRLWFLVGLAVLVPVLLRAPSFSPPTARIALSMGGVWMIFGALRRLAGALPTLALARDAWAELAPLLGDSDPAMAPAAAEARDGALAPGPAPARGAPLAQSAPLITGADLGYQYAGRPDPALAGVNVTVAEGERMLIQGASGGGKSTLAALLTGLRTPTAGELRLRGVAQQHIGLDRWRRTIAGAPQFHDNHVFCADLMFNVLMGRRWPPRLEDVEEAERVCRDVGLGPLLERMPAGLQQQVGETGWRLSHGERSRVFIARSLLQQVEARVLDESFAALDPETLDAVLAAVLARPQALIVIAHV